MMAVTLCMTFGTITSPCYQSYSFHDTPHLFSPVYGYIAQPKNYKCSIQLSAWSFTVKTVTPFTHVYFVVTGVITP